MLGKYCKKAIETMKNRKDTHGRHEDSFDNIAEFWTIYLRKITGDNSITITRAHVSMMMVLFKIARELNAELPDNIVDLIGYANLYGEMMFPEDALEDKAIKELCGREAA